MLNATDFYKTGHYAQYPEGTTSVYSNFTARSAKNAKMGSMFDDKTVFYGLQGFIKEFLIDEFNEAFFKLPKVEAVRRYKRRMDNALGPDAVSMEHIEALHDLGFLPVRIEALPEGSRVDIKVPYFTIQETIDEFFWVTNYLETLISCEMWKPITVATITYEYRRILNHYAELTGGSKEFTDWQIHDFSMRGMSGLHDAAVSGSAHLLSSFGTDTIPAIDRLEKYYFADSDKELIGGSVPATEHSVMCMGGKDDEIETFRKLITKDYPSGIVSIVSDTWDFWKVITEYARTLKPEILARQPNALGQAKVVFRPDSGDPADIICGNTRGASGAEYDGAIQCLWNIFGGTINEKGYKTLNQRVGLIYGDSITLERAKDILQRLADKGFASDNIVFGVGSFTYQYITRDTFGMAMKATWGVVNGEARELFKDPKTDVGSVKKSAKGLLRVVKEGSDYVLYDQQVPQHMWTLPNDLKCVFVDGEQFNLQSLSEIRERLKNE